MCDAKLIPLHSRNGSLRAYAIVDAEDFEWLRRWPWCLHSEGYVTSGGKFYMHRLIMGEPKSDVDHENGNRLDNRKSNLRVTTRQQNASNRHSTHAKNKSGIRGVHRWQGKWRAMTTLNYKSIHIGMYDTIDEAAEAVREYRALHMPYSAMDQTETRG